MIYIKKFNNNEYYNIWKNSDLYVMPNICSINKKISYQPRLYNSKIEYLESTGTQYIDTLYHFNPNTSFIWELKLIENSKTYTRTTGNNLIGTGEDGYIFTINFGDDINQYDDIFVWANKRYSSGGLIKEININSDVLTNKFTINYQNGLIKFNNSELSIENCTHTFNSTLILYSSGELNIFHRYNLCIYNFKIFENNNLIHNFIPVRKNNMGCLFDKIENKIFENQGTGDFILGPDI